MEEQNVGRESSSKPTVMAPQKIGGEALTAERWQRMKPSDDDTTLKYASEPDELVDLINSQGNSCDKALLSRILEDLELRGVTLRSYLEDIKPRLGRLRLPAGPGFFLHQARNWASSRPLQARSADEELARCAECGGGGYIDLDPPRYCTCPMGREVQRAERRSA